MQIPDAPPIRWRRRQIIDVQDLSPRAHYLLIIFDTISGDEIIFQPLAEFPNLTRDYRTVAN